jgi:hypothetical protein
VLGLLTQVRISAVAFRLWHALSANLRAARCAKAVSSKPYGRSHEAILKQNGTSLHQVDRGPHVMWTIINALYEEYCQARLDEMLRIDAVK